MLRTYYATRVSLVTTQSTFSQAKQQTLIIIISKILHVAISYNIPFASHVCVYFALISNNSTYTRREDVNVNKTFFKKS